MRYDIAIIGTGPAGISAALTAKNRNKSILLLGSRDGSDKIARSHRILNYPGIPGVSGADLNQKFLDSLKQMEIEITDARVGAIYALGDYYSLQVGQEFLEATAVIVTTGVSFGKPYPGEAENLGRGVSYCATCDAPLFHGKEVIVAGWSKKEEDEVRFLSEVCARVTYLPMTPGEVSVFRDNVRILRGKIQKISREDNRMQMIIRPEGSAGGSASGTAPVSAGIPAEAPDAAGSQANASRAAEPSRADSDSSLRLTADGIFLLRESVAPDTLVPGLELDGRRVKTDRNMATNLPGLFAAGDLTGAPYQIAKAVGEGNIAALSAVSWIDSRNG